MTRTTQAGIGAVIVGFLIWALGKGTGLTGTVTTSEGFDLAPYGGPTTYPQAIQTFANGIARAEGFYVSGSVPQRANNPGDLKVPGLPTLPGTSITQFDSVGAGWAALYRQLWLIVTGESSYYNLDMTISDMAATWTTSAPSGWAANVGSALGVDVSTPLYQVLV